MRTGSQRGQKKVPRAKRAGVIASAHVSNQRCDKNIQIRRQWTVRCTRKPLLTVSARIMLIYKQLLRSVNYLSQSCQLSSIQPIRSWYQELVSWNGGINGMSTASPAHSLLTRPLSVHPVRPRLHSAISKGSLFAGYTSANASQGLSRINKAPAKDSIKASKFARVTKLTRIYKGRMPRNLKVFTSPFMNAYL